jgi:creatinine amidohydrolase
LNLIETLSSEVENALSTVVLLPVGSLEQHGSEAPLGCDGIIAEALCLRAAKLTGAFVLPVLYYGNSNCHTAFPGTFSLSENTYTNLLAEIVRESARNSFKKILILSGHGGNRKAALEAVEQTQGIIEARYTGYWELDGVKDEEERLFGKTGYHITTSEVSMVWHLLRGSIPGRFTGQYPPAEENMAELTPVRWKLHYPDGGVGGDMTKTSVSKGKILFEFIADSLAKTAREMNEGCLDLPL